MSLPDDILFESDVEEEETSLLPSGALAEPMEADPILQLPMDETSISAHAQIVQAVADARQLVHYQHQPVSLQTMSGLLFAKYGAELRVRCTPGGMTPAQRMFSPSHKFLVLRTCREEDIVIDFDFRERFRLSRMTTRYQCLLEALPQDFVGSKTFLKDMLNVVCAAMVENFVQHDMPVPPWRKFAVLMHMWDAPNQFDVDVNDLLCRHQTESGSPRSVLDLGTVTEIRPVSGSMNKHGYKPSLVIVGFAAEKCVTGVGVASSSENTYPRATPSRPARSQQLDKLLGPVHKVKLGCA